MTLAEENQQALEHAVRAAIQQALEWITRGHYSHAATELNRARLMLKDYAEHALRTKP